MKKILTLAVILGSFPLSAVNSAHATCVMPFDPAGNALPSNDVSVDGFAFESASVPLGAFEVDMNGVQRGIRDENPWATHGTMVVLVLPTGEIELITSWSQNTSVDGVEWVCRTKPDASGLIWTGSGSFHSPLFGSGNPIARCIVDLVADC